MSELKVTKHNDLITSKINFTLNEYRIFLYGISLINPKSEKFPLDYVIDIRRFSNMFNCDLNGLYSDLKNDVLKRMFRRSMTIKKNGVNRTFGIIHYVEYFDDSGFLRIIFDDELQPFVQDLKSHFTSYYLEKIAYFKSTYSIRFYEFCIMYLKQNKGKPTQFFLPIKEIKERLEIEKKYKLYSDLKRRVIEKAFSEINAYSDLSIRFTEVKNGRAVQKLKIIAKYKNWEKKEKQYSLNFDPTLKVN